MGQAAGPAGVVIDASVALTWCFTEEATPATEAVLDSLRDHPVVVPSLWFLELSNALSIAERKRRIAPAKSKDFATLIGSLDVEVDHESAERAFTELLPLSRAHALTSYDAAYLDLANRRSLPLATLDDPLRKAAAKLGVELLGR